MNPMNPPDELVMLSHRIYMQTGWHIPPSCWSLAAGTLFMIGVLLLSIATRLYVDHLERSGRR